MVMENLYRPAEQPTALETPAENIKRQSLQKLKGWRSTQVFVEIYG